MLLVSCSKGRIEEEPTIEPTKTIVTETNSLRFSAPICEYYFNNARVAEDTYSLEDTTLNLIIQKVSDEKIIFFSYSSLAAYLQKGTELGLNLQKVLEIENDLQSYAQSIGAIDLYDNTGVIDARYTAFEENILTISQTTKKDKIKEYSLVHGLTKVRLIPHRELSTREFLRLCGLVLGKKKSVALHLCFYTVKTLYIKKRYSEREWLH
jgi:hypothetical protein